MLVDWGRPPPLQGCGRKAGPRGCAGDSTGGSGPGCRRAGGVGGAHHCLSEDPSLAPPPPPPPQNPEH